MSDDEKDIIIFTGQSGIKLESCINKLSANGGIAYKPIKIDKYMKDICGEKFVSVLGKPPRIQESLWIQAFNIAKDEIPQSIVQGKYIFLTFHACYFHQRKTDFTCPVSLGDLSQIKHRTKMVIVLLDDCYDIYRRLMIDGQMYDSVMKSDPLEALSQSLINLVTLLNWRETEIAFSRKIAQLLGVSMYTISVKHASFMISRLITKSEKSLKIFYLSHPISSIRKGAIYPRLPEFYAELNLFIRELLRFDNMVLFVPDTIDELRIVQGNGEQYIPELADGWPLPYQDKWLWRKLPSAFERINPLNPRNYPYSDAKDEVKSAISSQIRILASKIKQQINSRDRTLVEQSKDGIIVFRPYWAASAPSGVMEEAIYNLDLKEQYGENRRKTYMLTTSEDLGKLRIKKLFTLVEDSVNITSDDDIKKVKNLCDEWLSDSKMISSFFDNSYDTKRIREDIERVLPGNYEFRTVLSGLGEGALAVGKMLHKAEQLDRGWSEIFQVAKVDPLHSYTAEKERLVCSSDKFEEQFKDFAQGAICR